MNESFIFNNVEKLFKKLTVFTNVESVEKRVVENENFVENFPTL